MKKFLLILLIAVAASVKIQFDGTELQSKWTDFWKKVWDWIKTIPAKLKALYDWLRKKGIWQDLVTLLKNMEGLKPLNSALRKLDGKISARTLLTTSLNGLENK